MMVTMIKLMIRFWNYLIYNINYSLISTLFHQGIKILIELRIGNYF
jgi:hypothetical protein